MTPEELKKNWEKYALKMDDNGQTCPLKEMYQKYWGAYAGGLCFVLRDQPGDCDLLRPDKDGNCYTKVSLSGALLKKWILVGKFLKLKSTKKKRSTK